MSLHRVAQRLRREYEEHERGTHDGHAETARAHAVFATIAAEDLAAVQAAIAAAEEPVRLSAVIAEDLGHPGVTAAEAVRRTVALLVAGDAARRRLHGDADRLAAVLRELREAASEAVDAATVYIGADDGNPSTLAERTEMRAATESLRDLLIEIRRAEGTA